MTDFADQGAHFLTLADAAEILAVDASDVMSLITSGELPAIRVSGHWRIERRVLEAYIDAMYEESRRRALWEQSDFANLPELSGGTIITPQRRP